MKIAVVGPSPVPYTVGGMEKLLWDMVEKINSLTAHKAEMIKLPSRESSFWELIGSYRDFWELDLSHFDMVISTKYPSWMVSHPNHVCYMVHKLRGLYDTYHNYGFPESVSSGYEPTNRLAEFLDDTMDNPDIGRFWEKIDLYRHSQAGVPAEDIRFPGPLIRKIVHYMDNYALDPSRITRYCTMSRTVAGRKDYFPKGISPSIANPPPSNDGPGEISYGDYFFTVSRLDNSKRVGLLIKAMGGLKKDIKLVIAGTGPAEKELIKLAESDPRIELKGYCSDEEVSKLYAGCLAVLYVPFDEDYGLVTVEAFLRKKPVITCLDSGGTTEFVADHENGFVVKPDPSSLAKAMGYFCNNPGEAMRMGASGSRSITGITWKKFTDTLIGSPIEHPIFPGRRRKKILVTSTFPIYPPTGGGQVRSYYLYKNLAKYYDVEILSFTGSHLPAFDGFIAPGLREVRIPKSARHQEKENSLARHVRFQLISDVAMPSLSRFTPEYGRSLMAMAKNADMVILSHPYLYDEAVMACDGMPFIYEAQDIELDLKSKVLPPKARKLLEDTYRVEKLCARKSDLIVTCSGDDAKRISRLYGVDDAKILVVPNGVDTAATSYISRAERMANKKKIGLENEQFVLFMGSWHPPNIEACEEIFNISKRLPSIKFLLIGSQCQGLQYHNVPPNVALLGTLDEREKNFIFSIADIAINPMLSGSGTNLKMLDYMAAGIPVVTTAFGARGLGINGGCITIANDVNGMEKEIVRLIRDGMDDDSPQREARMIMESEYDWKVVARNLIDRLGRIGHMAPVKTMISMYDKI